MLLGLDVRTQLSDIFSKELVNPVNVKLFSQTIGCDVCQTTEELLKEVAKISDKINLEIYSAVIDKEMSQKYNISRVPTIVIEGDKDYGIRYIGLPSGLEFSTLVKGIILVSKRTPELSSRTLDLISAVDLPIEIMVFVTTSCGYCPSAAITAMNFALANDNISAVIVDATENPDLAQLYQVVGVPKIVINQGLVEFVGAQPENAFLGYIMAAYEKLKSQTSS